MLFLAWNENCVISNIVVCSVIECIGKVYFTVKNLKNKILKLGVEHNIMCLGIILLIEVSPSQVIDYVAVGICIILDYTDVMVRMKNVCKTIE